MRRGWKALGLIGALLTMLVAVAALGCGTDDEGSPAGSGGTSGTGEDGAGSGESGSGGSTGAGGTEYGSGGQGGSNGGGEGGSGGSNGGSDGGDSGSSGAGDGGGGGSSSGGNGGSGGIDIGETLVCEQGQSEGDVQQPTHVMNLEGQTGWFASPLIADLDGNGSNELIAAYYSIYVFDSEGNLLDRAQDGEGRVYAPHVVADLDSDGVMEVVAGNDRHVWAWEWRDGALQVKSGWPADTTTAGEQLEVRGLAAADLDGDGNIEVVATTTQTLESANGGAQVFVYSPNGELFQPAGGHSPAWPRYNALPGPGNDADRNGQGHNGYGCYGLNVGIGDVDDDPELEIIVTYDNHHIQAFDLDGVAIDASPWFTNRDSDQRLTWGQFIRWADPQVEADHYHDHTGTWPNPSWTEWLQWTHSPPSVVDLDLDGQNEVLAVPNIEMDEPDQGYVTQAWGIMVLQGAYGDGSASAMRKSGWEIMPRGDAPIQVDGWYPPSGVPAAAVVNVLGDEKPEIIVSLNDGFMYLFDAGGSRIWRFNYTHGKSIMFASEATVADLNQDGAAELVFTTFGDPDTSDSGFLIILGADGSLLFDIPLPEPGHNGNGNGAPAAPAIGDLDGDGQLEIFVQTFDHAMDVFTVPGSAENCLLWPTARGGPLRTGSARQAP